MKDLNEVILGTGPGGELIGSGTDASVSQTSAAVNLNYRYGISIQAVITGTAAGTLKLQGSDDFGSRNPIEPAGSNQVVNWSDIANSSAPVTGAGTASWNFQGSFYKWIRLVYTASSGTGTINVRANSKGF
jgi:hypothetical protein